MLRIIKRMMSRPSRSNGCLPIEALASSALGWPVFVLERPAQAGHGPHSAWAAPFRGKALAVCRSLKATLADDSASLNERLRRVFAEFQIQLAEDGETILVLPVLLPDVIEAHGGSPDTIGVIEGSDYTAMQDETASGDAPLMLIVPPPVRGVSIDTKQADRLSLIR